MARIIIFDLASGRVKQYIPSGDTPQYERRADTLINPDMSPVEGVDVKWWMVDPIAKDGFLREMSIPEKDIIIAREAAQSERAASVARATRGRNLIAELNVEMVASGMSEIARSDLVVSIQDVVVLLMSGQLKEAKRLLSLAPATARVLSKDLDTLKTLLDKEIP